MVNNFPQILKLSLLTRIIDNGKPVITFLQNSLKTGQIIIDSSTQSLSLIYAQKFGK